MPASKHLYGRMLNLGDAILLQVVRYDNFPVIEKPERFVWIANTLKNSPSCSRGVSTEKPNYSHTPLSLSEEHHRYV